MFDIGGGELILILFAVLLFFGPKKIPELAKTVGNAVRHVRKAQQEFSRQIHTMSDEVLEIKSSFTKEVDILTEEVHIVTEEVHTTNDEVIITTEEVHTLTKEVHVTTEEEITILTKVNQELIPEQNLENIDITSDNHFEKEQNLENSKPKGIEIPKPTINPAEGNFSSAAYNFQKNTEFDVDPKKDSSIDSVNNSNTNTPNDLI